MVKVIGKDVKAVKQVTCYKCASILEYTLNEVGKYIDYDYGGGSDTIHFVSCPTCGNNQTVKGY